MQAILLLKGCIFLAFQMVWGKPKMRIPKRWIVLKVLRPGVPTFWLDEGPILKEELPFKRGG
jgi:hypothetical protein